MINIDLTKEKGLEINFTGQVIGADGSVVDKKINDAKSEITQQIGNDYYKKAVVDKKINEVRSSIPSLESYATREYVDRSIEDKSLSLDGGTMLGDINMNGKRIDNIGIEEVNSLPTANLYEGRMVRFKNKTYTFYNGLWLALSDDLRGHANDTHEENFVYQPTASDLSVKDGFADIKKLKGNTMVWNQMFDYSTIINDNKAIYDNLTGIFTCTPTNQGFILQTRQKAKINHYHLISYEIKSDNNAKINSWNGTSIPTIVSTTSNWQKVTSIVKCTDDTRGLGVASQDGVNPFEVKNLKAFDLTQMFGEGNEPTIEEFEDTFPNSYYEYNKGELMSFDGKGVKSVGFNQWDEEWINKQLTYATGDYNTNPRISSKNFIHVLPNTEYYFLCNSSKTIPNTNCCDIFCYDVNKKYIGSNSIVKLKPNTLFTIPDGAYYIKFSMYASYGSSSNNVYNNDICINLSHSGYRNGDYESYEDYTLSFQDGKTISQLTGKLNGKGDSVVIFPEGLKSAGKVYDEIVYDEATGKHKAIKRIGSVDMGILSYMYNTDKSVFYTPSITSIPKIKTNGAVISVKYPQYIGSITEMLDKQISTSNYHYNNAVIIKDTSYTDVDSFKASLQGQILYYELETPEVYELDFPINTSYEAYDFGTEEVLYNDDKEVNIPMKANIEYGFNAIDMIRNNFEEIRSLKERVTALEQAILQIQAANTANEQIE